MTSAVATMTEERVEPAMSVARGIALGVQPAAGDIGAIRAWIPFGVTCHLTATREQATRLVAELGSLAPKPGARLVVLGTDVRTIATEARNALRARIGILPAEGGLISHLDAWENIVLPLGYHHPQALHGAEERVMNLIRRCGLEPRSLLPKLLEEMTPFEARVTAFVRLMLDAPELVIAEDFPEAAEGRGNQDSDERAFAAVYRAARAGGTFIQLQSAHRP